LSKSLYDILVDNGYKAITFPATRLDKLAIKYKIIRKFRTPKYDFNENYIHKGSIIVIFGDYDNFVDVSFNGNRITFGKRAINEGILDYIQQLEREQKLKRILC